MAGGLLRFRGFGRRWFFGRFGGCRGGRFRRSRNDWLRRRRGFRFRGRRSGGTRCLRFRGGRCFGRGRCRGLLGRLRRDRRRCCRFRRRGRSRRLCCRHRTRGLGRDRRDGRSGRRRRGRFWRFRRRRLFGGRGLRRFGGSRFFSRLSGRGGCRLRCLRWQWFGRRSRFRGLGRFRRFDGERDRQIVSAGAIGETCAAIDRNAGRRPGGVGRAG